MLDLAGFRAIPSPEFDNASDELVTSMLAEAALELVGAVDDWGDLINTAHRLLTSDKLWQSPYGATMRLDGGGEKEDESRYAIQLRKLHRKTLPAVLVL